MISRRGASAIAVLLLAIGCAKLFPPPERPRSHGYTARVESSIGGKRFSIDVAIAPGRERRDFGNPGARRSLILLHDSHQAIELDEAQRRAVVRPIANGETLFRGFSFAPTPLPERRFAPDVAWRQLADAGIGLHPCDVVRIERRLDDGTLESETLYLARDLDGLALMREVARAPRGERETIVEVDRLEAVDFPLDGDPFAIPEDYAVERRPNDAPVLESLPPL